MSECERITTTCCIAGGGPAGMMLGYLLARAGIDVTVLEKHADFLRDFRGDTVHPSTLEVMDELGLLGDFLACPHQKTYRLRGFVGDTPIAIADFARLKRRCNYIAFMPQWDFLEFLRRQAMKFPNFHLHMQTEAVQLHETDGHITGLVAKTPDATLEINSTLVVAADGRHSAMRREAGLKVMDIGAPMDVFWFAVPRHASDPDETLGYFTSGRIMALLNRQTYWQCAYVIPKGAAESWRARPIEAFRQDVAKIAPFLAESTSAITTWEDVRLLSVTIDRLEHWYRDGFLCIGDAAHAMSPMGGVGINLAIQDAVAAANTLVEPLRRRHVTVQDLGKVQKRRLWPTRMTQGMQVVMQNRIIRAALSGQVATTLPWPLRLLNRFPVLQMIPAYIVGIGFRPEHIAMK